MNKNLYLFIGFLLILFSCVNENRTRELLIGDWKLQFDTTEQQWQSTPHEFLGRLSYNFINDSIVDTKDPYYYFSRSEGRRRSPKFLGTLTKYRIKDDSIQFYNPSDSIWGRGRQITKISSDSLLLRTNTGYIQTFTRLYYDTKPEPVFDKIILSTSGCFGVCPIINIIINSNGDVVFYSERYVDKTGFYESNITREKYAELEYNFRKADFEKLANEYSADWSDDETITTTFYKDDKIVKSIEDYGKTGPDELRWAYTKLRHLYPDLNLKKISQENIPFYIDLHYFKFQKGNEVCDLTQAESFLLWDLLRKGSQTEKQVDKKYNLTFTRNYTWAPSHDEMEDPYHKKQEDKLVKIETDGQLYKLIIKDQNQLQLILE